MLVFLLLLPLARNLFRELGECNDVQAGVTYKKIMEISTFLVSNLIHGKFVPSIFICIWYISDVQRLTLFSYIFKDSCLGETGVDSLSDLISSYKPIFRSGSCAEKGPKPYMEDEHICIDDLPQHLSDIPGFSSCAAFYGVS